MANSTLYIVATPIGNLSDISKRAIDVLSSVDAIFAEDTRHTKSLLMNLGINKKLISLNAHNETDKSRLILNLLNDNKNIALVSDAGTPAISDPGAVTVDFIRRHGFNVVPIPGASALVAALSVSGISQTEFHFIGFLPQKEASRNGILEKYQYAEYPVIFYEAPHRILATVKNIIAVLGENREIVLVKELTKLHETIIVNNAKDVLSWLESDKTHQKGEFVIIVNSSKEKNDDLVRASEIMHILQEKLTNKDAILMTSKITGINKNKLYELTK